MPASLYVENADDPSMTKVLFGPKNAAGKIQGAPVDAYLSAPGPKAKSARTSWPPSIAWVGKVDARQDRRRITHNLQ